MIGRHIARNARSLVLVMVGYGMIIYLDKYRCKKNVREGLKYVRIGANDLRVRVGWGDQGDLEYASITDNDPNASNVFNWKRCCAVLCVQHVLGCVAGAVTAGVAQR